MSVAKDLADFLTALEETPDLWCSVDVRVVAIRVEEVWHHLFSRFRLLHLPPEAVPRPSDFPRLPYFNVFQAVHPLGALPDLIASIQGGTLEVGGTEIHFVREQEGSTSGNYVSSSVSIGRRFYDGVRGPFQHGHALTLGWDSAREYLHRVPRGENGLDAALRGLPDPWGGISAVRLYVLEESFTGGGDARRSLAIVAPLQARICATECALVEGRLTYTVEAASRIVGERCSLVITGVDNRGNRVARRVSLSRRRWAKTRNGYRYTGQERLRRAKLLDLTLQIATFEVGQVEIEAQSETLPLLLRAYSAVLGSRNFARGLLEPSPTQARDFETHVALLFLYCGLPTEHIGDASKTDAPDLLVEVPGASLVLVVEITVGPLNQKGKLARLTQRADQVRAHVEPNGDHVLPVIVTANVSTAIAANELEAAEADGIRVLSRDDLKVLLDMAMHRATVKQVARYLAPGLVPGPRIGWALSRRDRHALEEELD